LAGPENNQEAALALKISQLLAEQPRSPVADLIGRHVWDILEAYVRETAQSQELCLTLLRDLLGIYAQRLPAAATLEQLEVRLLQLRLAQRPDRAELQTLRNHLLALARQADQFAPDDSPQAASSAAAPVPAPPQEEAAAPAVQPEPSAALSEASAPATMPAEPAATPAPAEPPAEDRRLDIANRRQIDEKRARIQKTQETLARQVRDVIKQNERFGALLSTEHRNLLQSDDIESLQRLKESLLGEVLTLQEGHSALTKKLETANNYLQIIETEGQYLNDELTRVHILSLTDELTELPNRRAFMRRLEDEVARVQRYGYPLSLALIDMDHFKAVNDLHGHAAGDEVLRNFSTNILSIFRHHDMVARYGGEEFAVLLPNTDKAGALRALEKVRKRTAESPYQLEGRTMPMPTFSAGISLYKPGETPGNLIERADKALYQAKRLGRNRIELAQHDGAENPVR
jgi:diguanylate cyclase (GGDEF)-like protein